MPKQVQKFARFEGGINEGADPRDVSENELAKSDNIIVDDLGKLRLIGKVADTAVHEYTGISAYPGYGLFAYSTDYDASGGLNSTDWVALLNNDDGNVELRHKTQGSDVAVIANAIDLGADADDNEAEYYFADGALRVSQANLTKSKDTRWYGYVKENFFQTTDGGTASGTPITEKSDWVSTLAANRSPSQLGVNLDLHEGTTSNPSAATVGATAGDKIVVSYWKSSNGGWTGVFSLAATFVYKGGAESSMSKFIETVVGNEQKVSFQVYIPIGTSGTPAADAGNGFGDDRIVGINLYFKEFESKDYTLLTKIDLLTGGEDHWLRVNATDSAAYGVFESTGSVVVSEPAKTTYNTSDHWSYHNTTCAVTIDNDATGFTGRSGYVRLFGGHVSPIYATATTNLGDGVITFSSDVFLNGGPGKRVLKAELLDESFNVLKESAEFEYTIEDSDREAPPSYEDEDPYGSQSDYDDDKGN